MSMVDQGAIISRALEELTIGVVKQTAPLLVAETYADVVGVITMHPKLKSYCTTRDYYNRAGLKKTWRGPVLFLNGEENEEKTQAASHNVDSDLKGKQRVSGKGSEKSGSQISGELAGRDDNRVPKKSRSPKTGAR